MRTELLTRNPASLCARVKEVIDEFNNALKAVRIPENPSGTSTIIANHLDSCLLEDGWHRNELVSSAPNFQLPLANYQIDYFYLISDCECGKRHKVFINLCFDNRQAAGSHFLKFQLAGMQNRNTDSQNDVFIAVAADVEAKKKYGWDGSTSTYEFLSQAFEAHYEAFNKVEIDFLVVRA